MTMQGKKVVFTGALSMIRAEASEMVERAGGQVMSSVGRGTSLIIVGEKPGSKLATAVSLNVPRLTEAEFLALLEEEAMDDKPLTAEELAKLESHLVYPMCRWCNNTYRQWDTLPVYNTCPVCEILTFVRCPHCDDDPNFVEDFNLYHCMVCSSWFEAPFSVHARRTKHLHMWIKVSCTGQKIREECICGHTMHFELPEGASYKDFQDIQKEEYKEAPEWVRQKRREAAELEQAWEEERKHQEWFDSLTDEQKERLKEQVGR